MTIVPKHDELITVIIIHWGESNLLNSCIKSVIGQFHSNLEIVIINNSGRLIDKSILGSLPGVVINNKENSFYSESLNQGIRMSKAEFVLALNNDVLLDKNFIYECLSVAKINSRIGMVSGKILNSEGKRIDSTGQFLGKNRKPIERGYMKPDIGQFNKACYIFGVGGMAAFYRKKMLNEIKIDKDYFDSNYKMFYEDLDLNWRARRFGWNAYYTPYAIAYHKRGSSAKIRKKESGLMNKFYFPCLDSNLRFHVIKNRYMTIIKNEKLSDFMFNLFWILSYDLILWAFVLFNDPKLIIKLFVNIKYLKIAFKERKYINNKAKASHY